MIHVIVFFDLHPGQREAFLAEFRKIVPLVHAEHGCIEYVATVDVESGIDVFGAPRADRVTIVEKWESVAELKAHLDARHMTEFRPKVAPLIADTQLFITEPA